MDIPDQTEYTSPGDMHLLNTNDTTAFEDVNPEPKQTLYWYRGENLIVLRSFVVYLGPLMIIFGMVGNVLIIAVLSKTSKLKQRSTSVYPITMAVVNILAINLRLLDHMLAMHGLNLQSISYAMCKILTSLVYGITQLHLWLFMNLAVERVIALYHRTRGLFENDNHTICLFLVSTSIVVVTINVAYMPVFMPFESNNNTTLEGYCDAGHRYYNANNGWFWVRYAAQWAIPSIVFLTCIILVALRIAYSYHRKKHSEVINYVSKLKMCGVTISTLILEFLMLLSTIPQVILQPLMLVCIQKNKDTELCDAYAQAILYIDFFMNFNYLVNVVVFATWMKPFRQALQQMYHRGAHSKDMNTNGETPRNHEAKRTEVRLKVTRHK